MSLNTRTKFTLYISKCNKPYFLNVLHCWSTVAKLRVVVLRIPIFQFCLQIYLLNFPSKYRCENIIPKQQLCIFCNYIPSWLVDERIKLEIRNWDGSLLYLPWPLGSTGSFRAPAVRILSLNKRKSSILLALPCRKGWLQQGLQHLMAWIAEKEEREQTEVTTLLLLLPFHPSSLFSKPAMFCSGKPVLLTALLRFIVPACLLLNTIIYLIPCVFLPSSCYFQGSHIFLLVKTPLCYHRDYKRKLNLGHQRSSQAEE